jgi:hypothetical protein
MKKTGIAVVVILVLAITGYYIFDKLGGNTPIEIVLVNKSPDALTGKTFEGIPLSSKLEETFGEIETLQALNPGTKIHTIYYVEPAGKLDTLKVFVGVDLPFASGEFEGLAFSETQYILAKVSGNKWVMPGPEKVKQSIIQFAEENQLKLSGIFIDKIISEAEIQVIAPVK